MTLAIPFSGPRAGAWPQTVGQRNVLDWVGKDSLGAADVLTLRIWTRAGLPALSHALSATLTRHESLRSTHLPEQGTQQVAGRGELRAALVEAVTQEELALATAQDRPFGLADEYPVRVTILTRRNRPYLLVLHLSHIAADWAAAVLLRRELAGALAGERAAPPPAVQPVDLAVAEQSPRARRQLDAAIDHWVTVLGRHPARALPPRDDSPYRGHHHVILRSPGAGDVLARRAPCAPSSVLLAALARAIDRRYGSAEGVMHVLCANRQQPETAHYIGTISQETLVGYRLPPGACLTQTSRILHGSALRAYRRGRYDHERLKRTIAELGIVRHRDVVINNISGYPGAGPGPGPRLETSTGPEDTPLTLTVYELAPRLVCKLSVDERYLDGAQAREFLAEIEEELLSMRGVS